MSIKFAKEFQICENSCRENQASKSLTLVRSFEKYALTQKIISFKQWYYLIDNYPFSYFQGERATGYGVAILNTLFGKFSKSNLLKDASTLTEKNAK